jgi:colicin import membrane protein
LAEKSEEVKRELEEIKRAKATIEQMNLVAHEELEIERKRINEEAEAQRKELEKELERRSAEQALFAVPDSDKAGDIEAQRNAVRAQMEKEFEEREKALAEKYEEKQAMLAKEQESIRARSAELQVKEQQIATEEIRIKQESAQVTTLITEKTYTREERNRILADYSSKIEELRDRLRVNEKAIRDNNKDYVPLRRIKDTLERDTKLLRKREAVVAKQQVLVYGVNNITELDPARIKKLEQDVQQLAGLQQSVANCEDIMHKNKDRYPTLDNLNKVLQAQNKQILSDIEEMNNAIVFFESVDVKN